MYRTIQTGKSYLLAALLLIMPVASFALISAQPAYATGSCARPGASCTVAAASMPCSNITKCDLITKYVDPLVNALTALVGVAVVVSIIIGGIQYSSSEGDPGKASAAKNRIKNAIIALVAFILLYSFLNFLIPGGLV